MYPGVCDEVKTVCTCHCLPILSGVASAANSPDELNDLEIAHVAYTADNIDIQYAHLALAISQNPDVREFAKTMIRDHEAVNAQALACLLYTSPSPRDKRQSRMPSSA